MRRLRPATGTETAIIGALAQRVDKNDIEASPPIGEVRGHRCAVYPSSSVTDAQWAILEPLLLPAGNTRGYGGRPEKYCRRVIIDSIFYVVRGGIAWRQLSSKFPPATTVWAIFGRWVRAGCGSGSTTRCVIARACGMGAIRCRRRRIIDSQSVQGSDTVPRFSRGYDAGKKTNGRKRHIAVDTNGLLLAVVVTMAGIQKRDGAFRVLAALRARFSTISLVWADGSYAGRLIGWAKSVCR